MKYILTFFVALTILNTTHAQKYSLKPVSNTIHFINVNELTIEGYDGNEVIFESDDYDDDEDGERTDGLRLVNSTGLKDNTALGLSVDNTYKILTVNQVKNNFCNDHDSEYIVRIPKNMNVRFENSSWDSEDLQLKNIEGEIEVSANHNDIYLENVTGPMAVKTVYGSIDAKFKSLSQSGSVTLYSVYEYVDISLPQDSKSNINFKTSHGNIYTDMDIKVDKSDGKKKSWIGDHIKGNLNGGGVDLVITATHDNIYLRSNK